MLKSQHTRVLLPPLEKFLRDLFTRSIGAVGARIVAREEGLYILRGFHEGTERGVPLAGLYDHNREHPVCQNNKKVAVVSLNESMSKRKEVTTREWLA